jgi:2-deoxy-D-gluconate 3-dehydrogenase
MTITRSPFDLQGRVAIVTGGNGGIGRSIALGLARAGAAVAVLARNRDKNESVLADLKAIHTHVMARHLDVTERDTLAPALAEVERVLGGVGILVNNAGNKSVTGGVLNEPAESWDNVIETHLNSTFLLSQLTARSMRNRRRGKIINLASMYSFFGSGVVPSYSTAKGGIVQLTKSMAVELAPHNIQVNAIAPGWIKTDLTANIRENPDYAEFNRMILARTPVGRWGLPDECVGAVVFLASDAADFITGVTLPVDGGYSVA